MTEQVYVYVTGSDTKIIIIGLECANKHNQKSIYKWKKIN